MLLLVSLDSRDGIQSSHVGTKMNNVRVFVVRWWAYMTDYVYDIVSNTHYVPQFNLFKTERRAPLQYSE